MSETPVKLTQPCLALVQRGIDLSFQELEQRHNLQPFMLVSGPKKDGERIALKEGDPEAALEQASEILSPGDGAITMYVIVIDGYTEIEGERSDCLLIEAGQTGLSQALQVMQPYRHADNGVEPLGGPQAIQNLPTRLALSAETEAALRQSMQPLFMAPYTLFALMKAPGEEPSAASLKRFQDRLAGGLSHPHPLVSACTQQSLDSVNEMLAIITREDFDVIREMESLGELLNREFKPEDAKQYRAFLIELAQTLDTTQESRNKIQLIETALSAVD